MSLTFTIIARQGDDTQPDGCVSISLPSCRLTVTEVYHLMDVLQHIARQMGADADPSKNEVQRRMAQ